MEGRAMAEDTPQDQAEIDTESAAPMAEEKRNDTTTSVSLEKSAKNSTIRFLWRSLSVLMRWIFRIVMSTVLVLVIVGSLTALVAGVVAALEEWDIWQGLAEQGMDEQSVMRNIFSSTSYRMAVIALASYVAGYLFMQFQYRNTFGLWFRPLKDARQIPVEKLADLQQSVVANEALRDFAIRYSKAWSSQNAVNVAAFFSPNGTLQINEKRRITGRQGITEAVQEFMDKFPDMHMTTADLLITGDRSAAHNWNLIVSTKGPDGNEKSVRISGQEAWKIGDDRLIAKSQGLFNKYDFQRRLGSEET